MTPFRHIEHDVFAELYGLALVNPRRLDELTGGLRGDLLTPFSKTALGDTVCEKGAAIPVLDITGEYYDVVVRDGPPSILTRQRKTSSGWILHVDDDALVLCGLGHLVHWGPDHGRHRRIPAPAGAYEVAVLGGEASPEKWGIEFVLTRASKPRYTADPNRGFGMHLE